MRLLDSFSDHISFHPCNYLSLNNYTAHFESLYCSYLWTSSSSSTLIVIINTSAISYTNIQAISAIYFWRLDYQVLSSKTPADRTTAPNAELFVIVLGVSKATSINIEHIILINNFLSLARRAVDFSVYSKQVHLLTIYSVLRLFFSSSLSHRIEF